MRYLCPREVLEHVDDGKMKMGDRQTTKERAPSTSTPPPPPPSSAVSSPSSLEYDQLPSFLFRAEPSLWWRQYHGGSPAMDD
jgi:hypothetical protein